MLAKPVHMQTFAEIREAFVARAHTAVLCAVATVDTQGRPRSRILHPIWDDQFAWVATFRDSHKVKHLAANPYASMTYMTEPFKPAYADCKVEWADDPIQKQYAWDLFHHTPPPLGYPMDTPVDDPQFGVLKFTPWRVEVFTLREETLIWRAQ